MYCDMCSITVDDIVAGSQADAQQAQQELKELIAQQPNLSIDPSLPNLIIPLSPLSHISSPTKINPSSTQTSAASPPKHGGTEATQHHLTSMASVANVVRFLTKGSGMGTHTSFHHHYNCHISYIYIYC